MLAISRLIFNQNTVVMLCALAVALAVFGALRAAVPARAFAGEGLHEVARSDGTCGITAMGDVAFCGP
ncbi:hypothetical protein M446_0578 [Methylobacterium sp. 4-46]|uniref:hypothetical protein n=1 Tax=unclassified Methylobacterium TaxID=2615210 RepID=UPI000165CA41|nr:MULTISPECIES: hypothetical protein [Methylobacterium]ACA15140.1 hypothetical protein M446_0578 [Methylobacterium sp. 4-46]WFT80873.1 hypothetical protein QA634_02930 [Methylobacterium nodulans]